jgi:hypothetical protein
MVLFFGGEQYETIPVDGYDPGDSGGGVLWGGSPDEEVLFAQGVGIPRLSLLCL